MQWQVSAAERQGRDAAARAPRPFGARTPVRWMSDPRSTRCPDRGIREARPGTRTCPGRDLRIRGVLPLGLHAAVLPAAAPDRPVRARRLAHSAVAGVLRDPAHGAAWLGPPAHDRAPAAPAHVDGARGWPDLHQLAGVHRRGAHRAHHRDEPRLLHESDRHRAARRAAAARAPARDAVGRARTGGGRGRRHHRRLRRVPVDRAQSRVLVRPVRLRQEAHRPLGGCGERPDPRVRLARAGRSASCWSWSVRRQAWRWARTVRSTPCC